MATSPTASLIEHLRAAALLPRDGAGLGDGELLGRFVESHDGAALAALVKRHGPMVWGTCRRLLGHHDAEDAFQATFLVLAKKASSIAPREMVGNWLYGVAHQTALQARRAAARRRAREAQVSQMPDTEAAPQEDQWSDVRPVLDQELSRLPDDYRAAVVLCDLEGRPRKEAARHLGCPEGTLAGRLARARAMLAKRLARRGVALSAGALAAVLAQGVASASVPASVASATVEAATLVTAAGQAAAAGVISAEAAALTEGVLKAMSMSKLKAAVAVVLVLSFVVAGATALACRTTTPVAAQGDRPPVASDNKPAVADGLAKAPAPRQKERKQEKEDFIAWGKEVGGLQAGLGLKAGAKRVYRHGETVTLVVRVRNVGKETVKFEYIWAFLVENPPAVTDADGKPVRLPGLLAEGLHMPRSTNVAPGKEVELYAWDFDLRAKREGGNKELRTIPGTGKFSLQCERVVGPTSANPNHPNPAMSKLATGKLELEVKAAQPKQEKEQEEKEALTAWGKEVGGLQAGLGLKAGTKRVYRHGETVTLVVRVRNVGKEEVKFEYLRQFLDETPPAVTDAAGKTIPQGRIDVFGFHFPVAVTLQPGQEIELESRMHGTSGLKYELRPARGEGKHATKESPLCVGAGKVSLRYERVFGDSSSGGVKLDPALAKLATGKLELEIRPADAGKE